jgi:hypothetical protein
MGKILWIAKKIIGLVNEIKRLRISRLHPSNLIRNYSDPVKDKENTSKDQLFEDN